MSGSVAVTMVINCPRLASSDKTQRYDRASNSGGLSFTSLTRNESKFDESSFF